MTSGSVRSRTTTLIAGYLVNQFRGVAFRARQRHIRLRNDADTPAIAAHDRHATNLMLLHDGHDPTQRRVLIDRNDRRADMQISRGYANGFLPSATARQTMSRSVTTPTGRSAGSITGVSPQLSRTINVATCSSGVSSVQNAGSVTFTACGG
jgi:hypothetical protein